jgi:uncharacterized protein (DUF2141 family)
MRKLFNYFLISFVCFALWRCATQTTPMGGPKDVKPPKFENSNPTHNQKNFKGKTIELSFNETIVLKNPKEEIIITPSPGKDVEMKTKGNVVTITPKAGWQDSTTYNINFRDAVQDITEGNPAVDLRLAFSTGPIIDSLSISGNVKYALLEKVPEFTTVALYAADTFNIFRHVPEYFTKSNKKGEFRIDNLKPGTYFIYAFDDKNKNLKVDSQAELFAFLADPVQLTSNASNLTLPLVKIDTRKLKVTSARSVGDLTTIKLSKSAIGYTLKEINNQTPPHSLGTNQSEVYVYLEKVLADSIQINLSAEDSLQQKIDTLFFIKKSPAKREKEKFSVSFTPPTVEVETGKFNTTFKANKLITGFNLDSVRIQLDSTSYIIVNRNDFVIDTTKNKGTISKILDRAKLASIKPGLTKLLLGKNYVTSIENDSIKAITLPIDLLSLEETGTLLIEVKPKTDQKFIVQILSQENKEIQSMTNQKKYTFKYLEPNTYKIRVIIDKNGNGKWDIGNIFLRQEPEPILYYLNADKKYEFSIRANWEVDGYTIIF